MTSNADQCPPSLGNAIALLLGRQASAGGPFALLGLTPEDCTQDLVIVQLQRQLARIAAHPMGTSPVADAVRAALHVATAELLEGLEGQTPPDATAHVASLAPIRRTFASPAIPPQPALDASVRLPEAPRVHVPVPIRGTSVPISQELATSAREILAEYGGWNARSRQRLAFLAYAAGVRVDELLAASQSVQPPPSSFPEARSPLPAPPPLQRSLSVTPDAGLYVNEDGSPKSQPFEQEIDPGRRVAKWIIIGIAGGFAALLALGSIAYFVLRSPRVTPAPPIAQSASPTPAPSDEIFPTPKTTTTAASPTPRTPVPPAMPRDFSDELHDITRSVASAPTDPDAALRGFDVATKSISLTWATARPDQLAAMQATIVEFVYILASDLDRATVVIDLLARGVRSAAAIPGTSLSGDHVRSAAWSAGMLARIARERELSSNLRLRLQSVLEYPPLTTWQGGESDFQSGATTALAALARSLTPTTISPIANATAASPDAWPAWIACVDALKLAPRDRDQMVLVALEGLLTNAPEPSQSKPTFDAISRLVTSVTWRESDESRRWLLRWFERPAVSVADLHTLTHALASSSSAGGFDVSMVLPASATDPERATLRDRLRQAWGLLDGPERTKLVNGWRESAEQELSQGPSSSAPPPHPLVEFYRAVVWSRLNESAGMILAGEPGSAYTDVSLDASVRKAIDSLSMPATPPPMFDADPAWVVRYLGAGSNIAAKKQALSEIYPSLQLPKAVGEVLVLEVLRGSTNEIRKLATELVRQHAGDPAIVHGWLTQVSSMPIFQEYSDLVSSASFSRLPSIRSPSWRVAARRALVERLLQLLAESGELSGVDNVSTMLAESYARRVATFSFNSRPEPAKHGEPEVAPPTESATNVAPLETSARLYRLRLEHEAREKAPTGREPMTLGQISSRHESRSKVASGRIQAFAAEQATSFELLAYITTAEHPDAAGHIAAILDETNIARRKASHIASQLEAVERGTLRVWLIRMEGGKL